MVIAFACVGGVTLDQAFGGKIRRQLQAKAMNSKAFEVAFEVALVHGEGASVEEAQAQVATKLKKSLDAVRDLYKRAGPKGARKRGGDLRKNPP